MAFGRLGAIGAGFGHLGASPGGGVAAPAGGAALLVGETDGFATDFTYATDASRVAVKVAGTVTASALDAFFTSTGASPKQVWDSAGTLGWSPHNMFLNSATPVTQSVTTVVGQNYTVTVVGSGSMTGSAGASGVATAGSPLTYTATTTTSTFTKAGTVTKIQMNRGSVATADLATVGLIRNGLAVDYHPSTHTALGLLCEPPATNLLLNSTTLSTQSVTVTAVAHTLSFLGTGTVTLTGVSTAGPLVGTGASNRVSLTFTPTAGSLTCTVTGTVSNAQLETGTVATSIIPTFGASATRAADVYKITSASINPSATAGSWWIDMTAATAVNNGRVIGYTAGGYAVLYGITTTVYGLYDGTSNIGKTVGTIAGSHKISVAFQSADRAVTADGLAPTTDVLAGIALGTPGATIGLGCDPGTGGSQANWYFRKVRYVPRRKSNSELTAETA